MSWELSDEHEMLRATSGPLPPGTPSVSSSK